MSPGRAMPQMTRASERVGITVAIPQPWAGTGRKTSELGLPSPVKLQAWCCPRCGYHQLTQPHSVPLGSRSLCPAVCPSAAVPGLDAHLSARESEAPGSLAVPWGQSGSRPQGSVPALGSAYQLAAMGTKMPSPLPESWHGVEGSWRGSHGSRARHQALAPLPWDPGSSWPFKP